MVLQATDLVPYAAQLMPIDDTSPAGGGIDTTLRVLFTDLLASDVLQIVSDAGGDTTQDATATVMNTAGVVVSQTVTLAGTTPVSFNSLGMIDRIESLQMAAPAAGNVTLRRASTLDPIAVVPAGELGFTRLFQGITPSASVSKTYYQKYFWKNTNATATLYVPSVTLTPDDLGRFAHCIAVAIDESGQIASRLTPPGAGLLAPPATFDATTRDIPATRLAPGEAIGIWLACVLPPSPPPAKGVLVCAISGMAIAS